MGAKDVKTGSKNVFEVLEPFRVYADVGYKPNGITHRTRKGSEAVHVEVVQEAINTRPGDVLFSGGDPSYLVRADGTQRRVTLRPRGYWTDGIAYKSDREMLVKSQRVQPTTYHKYADTTAVNKAVADTRLPATTPSVIETEPSPEMERFRRHVQTLLDAVADLRDEGLVDSRGNPPKVRLVDHQGEAIIRLRLSFDEYLEDRERGEIPATVFQLDWCFVRGEAEVHAHLGTRLRDQEPTRHGGGAHPIYVMKLSKAVPALTEAFRAHVLERTAAPAAAPGPR